MHGSKYMGRMEKPTLTVASIDPETIKLPCGWKSRACTEEV